MTQHFCTCPTTNCTYHPNKQNPSCDLCIQKNLRNKEIPSCFFQLYQKDLSDVQDYTINGFVRFYTALHKE